MIYRIILRQYYADWNQSYGTFGFWFDEEMTARGLKAPDCKINPRARFYFTEKGWDEVGRELYKLACKKGFGVVIDRRKNPKASDVSYSDPWQVALLPNKRR